MSGQWFEEAIVFAARLMEGVGVATMVIGSFVVAGLTLVALPRLGAKEAYRMLRHRVGRAILLGLELLVAADIIRTVNTAPTLEAVVVLGIVVVIRTLLSFALEVELEGRWPWQRAPELVDAGGAARLR